MQSYYVYCALDDEECQIETREDLKNLFGIVVN